MVDVYKIFVICPACNGTGEILDPNWNFDTENPTERPYITCIRCNGNKEVEWGRMREDID